MRHLRSPGDFFSEYSKCEGGCLLFFVQVRNSRRMPTPAIGLHGIAYRTDVKAEI